MWPCAFVGCNADVLEISAIYIIKAIDWLLHLRYIVSETSTVKPVYRRYHHPKAGFTLILHRSDG
jgi:hypothetical protein